eukprot:421362-Amphidinium_carterae.1
MSLQDLELLEKEIEDSVPEIEGEGEGEEKEEGNKKRRKKTNIELEVKQWFLDYSKLKKEEH